MPVEESGWAEVLKDGGWPALALGFVVAVIKSPGLLRHAVREIKGTEEKKRDALDHERDGIEAYKNGEIVRLRAEVQNAEQRIERLKRRVDQLMQSIGWWRDYARDQRHDWVNSVQRHRSHEIQSGIDVLEDPPVPPVPRVSEEDDADDFRS